MKKFTFLEEWYLFHTADMIFKRYVLIFFQLSTPNLLFVCLCLFNNYLVNHLIRQHSQVVQSSFPGVGQTWFSSKLGHSQGADFGQGAQHLWPYKMEITVPKFEMYLLKQMMKC